MLKVYYADVSELNITEKMKSFFTDSRLKKLEKAKNKNLSAGVEALLCYAIGEKPRYSYNENGKPYFVNNELFFNLSHSGSYVACALSDKPVGVDIQKVWPFKESVASKVCTKEELASLRESPNKEETFCLLWAKKEAFVKKNGDGIGSILGGIESDAETLNIEGYCLAVCGNGEAEFIEVSVKKLCDFFERM